MFDNLQIPLKIFYELLMKECIRTSGFFASLGASYKIALMRAPKEKILVGARGIFDFYSIEHKKDS